MTSFEFDLEDRIIKIQELSKQYDLENTSYVSFSGGKDSCALSKLIDLALPNNNIPRVYINTGIEYPQMIKFVKSLSFKDKRINVLQPTKNIVKTLKNVGYPFKSKQHSHNFSIYRNNIDLCDKYLNMIKGDDSLLTNLDFLTSLPNGVTTVVKYYYGIRIKNVTGGVSILTSLRIVPDKLKYQFTKEYALNHNYSDKCCYEFKKNPAHEYEKQSNRVNAFTGQRKEEGGNRDKLTCVTDAPNGKHFNVLAPLTNEFIEWFIKEYDIELCELYKPPFNFRRTGCLCCPFALDLQEQLDVLAKHSPSTLKQANHLWKPTYDEYRRIGYRLKRTNEYVQYNIFDYIEEGKND